MAVTACNFRRSMSASFDRRNRGTYNVQYDVYCDSLMGPLGIANGAILSSPHPLPALGAAYDYESILGAGEADPYSFALDYSIEVNESDRTRALISVTYTPLEPGETNEQRTNPDPATRGARFHWDVETVLKIADRDSNNQPIVNGANKSFDRPIQLERDRPLLVARFNVETLAESVGLTQTYSQAVNSSAWTYLTPNPAARTVLCKSARSGELVTEGAYSFYPMEFVFAFAEEDETWDEKILNEGYGHYTIAADQTYGYAIADDDFTTSTDPIPLTGVTLVKNPGSLTAPTTVPQPSPAISGKEGDQLSILRVGSAWAVADPTAKVDSDGAPIYQRAYEMDENGTETTNPVSEPVLLYSNGCRLPEGMLGNYITKRVRREVNFNDLNAYLIPS